jgi:hypothetical protein
MVAVDGKLIRERNGIVPSSHHVIIGISGIPGFVTLNCFVLVKVGVTSIFDPIFGIGIVSVTNFHSTEIQVETLRQSRFLEADQISYLLKQSYLYRKIILPEIWAGTELTNVSQSRTSKIALPEPALVRKVLGSVCTW